MQIYTALERLPSPSKTRELFLDGICIHICLEIFIDLTWTTIFFHVNTALCYTEVKSILKLPYLAYGNAQYVGNIGSRNVH